ncbi:MAG TPA: RluA family pseudouridine synthase [Bacteriovoracaceae bacterium]|nr:RluA family pseudouridine synthase [Bacteriovoracaceae bacterium]
MEDDFITLSITLDDLENFQRLDVYLAAKIPNLSRTFIKNIFEQELISLDNGQEASLPKLKLNKMPPAGANIVIQIPPPIPVNALPENLPLEILYEDEHLLFINKAAGMVTHPAPGNYNGTLVNAVLHHCPDLSRIGDKIRPGIVHRLDKGTSGVMVVAKNQKCHEGLIMLFSKHDIERKYEAILTSDKLPPLAKLESTIGRHTTNRKKMAINVRNGKKAITHFRLLEKFKHFSFAEFTLETGRTHQIRLHASALMQAPILGDSIYGNSNLHLKKSPASVQKLLHDYPYPLLHAKILGLVHPITKEKLFFEVKHPSIFENVLEAFRHE